MRMRAGPCGTDRTWGRAVTGAPAVWCCWVFRNGEDVWLVSHHQVGCDGGTLVRSSVANVQFPCLVFFSVIDGLCLMGLGAGR